MSQSTHGDLALYRRLLRDAIPLWPHFSGLLVVSLLSSPLVLLTPVPLKIAVDSVVGSKPLPGFLDALVPQALTGDRDLLLIFAVALLVMVYLLKHLQDAGQSILQTYVSELLVLRFRARLCQCAQRLSLSYHQLHGTADAVYRVHRDTSALPAILVEGVIPLMASGVTLLAMIFVIMSLDWRLGLVALSISPILFALSAFYRSKLRRQSREGKRLDSAAMSVLQEVLNALPVVKSFVQEDREASRFVQRSLEGMRARIRASLSEGALSLFIGVTMAAGSATVLFVGTQRVQSGSLTLGELLLIMSYLAQLYDPLKTMSKRVGALQASLASAERVYSLLDQPPDVKDAPSGARPQRVRGDIVFDRVSFGYGYSPPVLDDLSFSVPAGARVSVTGMTGAGKSTLVSLLMRFYDPQEGRILLDGIDFRSYQLSALRRQIAAALQEPVLFSTTIIENIAYARPSASMSEIITAAEAAQADEFIRRMPQGYDTVVDDRGMRLSVGQRQRVTLARAFLKDAPILVLDEPTSAVDAETETSLVNSVEQLMQGRTTFIISHRPAALTRCDFFLDMRDGRCSNVETMQLAAVRR